MQKINTSDGNFHPGNPATGADGTIVTQAWMQCIQDELTGICEAAGIALDATNNSQIVAAIRQLAIGSAAPTGPSDDFPKASYVGQKHLHNTWGEITCWQVTPPIWKSPAGVQVN
ncbi:hypothetical protein [Burkholderia glumae]|uniref:hypothetical protein n=1 Tax=Burkholderia glumae TaxID=337 RepID=UPI0013739030|nr:hypothetical protein [Burkholderia glumae]MCR1767876.1 hypothetical protein [Burkholderia glumae]QHP90379.1 hypothetical protein EXE55_05170 [Burkholderia glumae]QKM47700.1 hypothetical protein B7760_01723 [Burkholderia glumae]UVS96455.1 hypothetical protein EFP19_12325 [Burkholderia glumae]